MATSGHNTFQQATAHKQPRSLRAANRPPHAFRSAIHPTIIPLQFQLIPQQVLSMQSAIGNRAVVQLLRQQQGRDTQTANNTCLPEPLKTNMESLSGIDLSEVQVHYHSEKPAQLQALAYAQGEHIYLGAGQEQHLPHEAWHVVQQKQGRVKPTLQMKNGMAINNDPVLEKEADQWGEKALHTPDLTFSLPIRQADDSQVVQRVVPLLIKNKAEKDIEAEKEKKKKKERENKWFSAVKNDYGVGGDLKIKNYNNKSDVNVKKQIISASNIYEKLLNSFKWHLKENKNISNHNKYIPLLIPFSEFTSLYIYSRELYQEINKNLRGKKINKESKNLIEILIKKIDSGIKILNQFQYNTEGLVYRGVSDNSLENLGTGDIFTNEAFLSTSISKKQALNFLGKENRVLMEIHGKSGADISKISHYPQQKEVLFGQGKNFLIKQKISRNDLDYKVVKSLDDKIIKLDETLKEKILKEVTLSRPSGESIIEKEIANELKKIFSTVIEELGSLKKMLTILVMEEKEEVTIESMD